MLRTCRARFVPGRFTLLLAHAALCAPLPAVSAGENPFVKEGDLGTSAAIRYSPTSTPDYDRVSGHTEPPRLIRVAQQHQQKDHSMPQAPTRIAAAAAVPSGMTAEIAAALREIGPRIDGPATTALYAPLHAALKHDAVDVRRDEAYGPHERHRADVYLARSAQAGRRPVVVFVHGGGFSRGAKSSPGSPFYDNIGYWAAEHGLVGVTVNYRLAPEFQYPAGAEDVGRALGWLRGRVAEWGGDPDRIFLWGHSAGAAHVADYLVRATRPPVAGAILTSGIFDLGSTVSVWKEYYGEDVSRYAERSSLPRLIQVDTPLLVNWAELDPPDFVPDSQRLVTGRQAAGKPVVSLLLANHSHLSETYAIGTADESLSGPVLRFIQSPPR